MKSASISFVNSSFKILTIAIPFSSLMPQLEFLSLHDYLHKRALFICFPVALFFLSNLSTKSLIFKLQVLAHVVGHEINVVTHDQHWKKKRNRICFHADTDVGSSAILRGSSKKK